MNEHSHETNIAARTYELLSAGAEAELRFLKQERKAEKWLASARESLAQDERRLLRAQQRLDRGRETVAAAEESLRDAQARRAAGIAVAHD